MAQFFEDIEVGDTDEFGSRTITKDEIVEFGEQYDPQPFHVDEDAAEASMFGELIASGWHTASVCMRMLVENSDIASEGARGVDELRWLQPVRPGDTLSARVEVVDKRPSESNPAIGHVDAKLTGFNQHDDPVITWTGLTMVRRRNPGDE